VSGVERGDGFKGPRVYVCSFFDTSSIY